MGIPLKALDDGGNDVLNSARFVDQAPAQVHTALLDEGVYHCSRRTMYRILGWLLAERECAHLAARLIRETCVKQDVSADQLTIHSDRGPSMKSQTVAQLLAALGIIKSQSRPHVSNDNPFSESQFKTLKYRPEFPDRFGSYAEAHAFCVAFFAWYNDEHYHSGLAMLTPASVHYNRVAPILAQRTLTLQAAYAAHPERFVHGPPKPQGLPETVWINPPQGGML